MLPQKIWQNQEIDCKKYEKIRNFPQNFAKSGTRAYKQGKIKNLIAINIAKSRMLL